MRVFAATLLEAARSDATVLLEGETGTGKEVAAESLHAASARARGPFVTFDCAAVSPSLAGAELFGHDKGAYTGDVSAAMVAEFGSRYAIVGHSERRTVFGDTDEVVVAKFAAARRAKLTPIFCVGETLEEREAGRTEAVLARQVDALLDGGASQLDGAIVAYEPVWAIGTGKTATSAQAQEAHEFLRGRVGGRDKAVAEALPILYGGSVKASNAKELFAMPDVDGGLVGGASLVAEEFVAIWRAAGAH
jgi:triosephosphate isomerase